MAMAAMATKRARRWIPLPLPLRLPVPRAPRRLPLRLGLRKTFLAACAVRCSRSSAAHPWERLRVWWRRRPTRPQVPRRRPQPPRSMLWLYPQIADSSFELLRAKGLAQELDGSLARELAAQRRLVVAAGDHNRQLGIQHAQLPDQGVPRCVWKSQIHNRPTHLTPQQSQLVLRRGRRTRDLHLEAHVLELAA